VDITEVGRASDLEARRHRAPDQEPAHMTTLTDRSTTKTTRASFERAVAAATLATGSTTLGWLRALQHLAATDRPDDVARQEVLAATRRTLTDLRSSGLLPPEFVVPTTAGIEDVRRLLAAAWQHASDGERTVVAA
jgi:hypothetical protein